jgi:hypothetical protein
MKALLVAALLLLSSIVAAAADPLVGRWDGGDQGVTVTFRDDGTLLIETAGGATQDGTWSADTETLTMGLKPPGATETVSLSCLYSVAGDSLTIRPGDAKCGESSFTRAK